MAVTHPTPQELDEQYWAVIQGHGSPADRIALEALTEFPRTPCVPYTPDPCTERPNEPQSD